jgi:hypothetical protein
MPKIPDQAALIEVELLKEHTHNGELLDVGAKIQVDAPTAEWLGTQNIIAPPPPEAKAKPEMPAEQQAGSFS